MRPARAVTNLAINQRIQTVKSLLLSLFLVAPASAQSIDPVAYGKLYCQMRSMGVTPHVARSIAVQEAWLSNAPASSSQADIPAAAKYVADNCFEYLGN